jgi:hypothetical protein
MMPIDEDFDQPGRHEFECGGQPGKDKRADNHRAIRAKILKYAQ